MGAVLTQGTSWHNVEKAIWNLKEARLLSHKAIRDLPMGELARLLYPSGFYNSKAKRLRSLCQWLELSSGGDVDTLRERDTRELRKELLSIHGIGPETADAILLYALEKPVFVIDGYTRRIVDRLGLAPEKRDYRSYQILFESRLPPSVGLYNEFHALLVALGKDACRKHPHCEACCLQDFCPMVTALLGSAAKPALPILNVAVKEKPVYVDYASG